MLAWPPPELLEPVLPRTVTQHVWAGGCCGLGHRTLRLLKLYVFAISRNRHVVVDWGACVGTSVSNIYARLFSDWNEVAAVKTGPRGNAAHDLRAPACRPSGSCRDKRDFAARSPESLFENEPPRYWFPPGMEGRVRRYARWAPHLVIDESDGSAAGDAVLFRKEEWGMAMVHRDVFPLAERFAAQAVASLRGEWRAPLDDFVEQEFAGPAPVVGVHFRFGNGERFRRKPRNVTHVVLRTAAAVAKLAASLGFRRYRVFVATDDEAAIDVLRAQTDLDVVARDQWRPPRGGGVHFSTWRATQTGLGTAKSLAAQRDMTERKSGAACVRNSADMLLDALLLAFADALVLPVPSTFTVLPKVIAHSRGVPYCAFFGQGWHAPDLHRHPASMTCFRRHAATGRVADWTVDVEAEGDQAGLLGASFWSPST